VGVQFKLDGANLGSEKTSAPFSTSWDTTTTANGQHALAAVARNAAGQTGNSAPVSVTVQNSSGGPTVSITSPTSGATVSASATVSVNVSANTVGVQFKLDGSNLGSEVTAAPFSVSWDTTTTANGQHTLTAVARNAGGQTAPSTAVTVTVQNSSVGPPVISGVGAGPGSTTATIFWATDVPSDGQVDYGTTVTYGQSSTLDSTPVTGHFVGLSALTASTTYHFRVKSKSASGMATSSDSTFTTLAAGADGSLGSLAASMSPGTWAVLNTNGFNNGAYLADPISSGDYITQYADKAVWDAGSRTFFFMGSAHGTVCYAKFATYLDATSTWTDGSWAGLPDLPGEQPCFTEFHGHAYEHNAVSPGFVYHRGYNSVHVYRYPIASGGPWVKLPDISMANFQCCGALEWFPDRNELVFFDGDWGLWKFFNNAWTQIAAGNGGGFAPQFLMGGFQNFAQYSPSAHAIWFGGGNGSNKIYRYNSDGTFTTLNLAPFGLGVAQSVISVDPVSGNFLILRDMGAGNGQFWQYNVVTDVWTQLPPPPISVLSVLASGAIGDGLIATPISTYGVVMYLKFVFSSSRVYLYKHSGG